MLPVLTAPIAVPSVARIGEPDISEAITRSSCTKSKPPSCETAQSSHSPASDTTRAGAVPSTNAPARRRPTRAIAQGDALGAQKWRRLDGVDHPLIGFVLLAWVFSGWRPRPHPQGYRGR